MARPTLYDRHMTEDYNYARFDDYVADGREEVEFGAFAALLHAGDPAPEISGTLLDGGEPITLSKVWRSRTVVVEFGTYT